MDGARSSPTLAISNAIVGLHKQHFGKGPESARTHIAGDTVVVLLRGGYLPIEQTLYDSGHGDAVLEQRRHWQAAMGERFKDVVREICGREVVALMSANHQNPDLAVEVFVLGEPTAAAAATPGPAAGDGGGAPPPG